METIVQVERLVKVYGSGAAAVRALDGVDLQIGAGQFVAVTGPSGSGKSTLLHLIGGLDMPTSGRIWIDGREITAMGDRDLTLFRRRRLGVVFQSFNLLPMLTASQNVGLPLLLDWVKAAQVRPKVERMLELCQLTHRADHLPDMLSGGEQQRVAIARALLNEPAVLLADEPTGNLDSQTAQTILGLLGRLSRELGRTVLMVTHEVKAAEMADQVIVLKDGRIVEARTQELGARS